MHIRRITVSIFHQISDFLRRYYPDQVQGSMTPVMISAGIKPAPLSHIIEFNTYCIPDENCCQANTPGCQPVVKT